MDYTKKIEERLNQILETKREFNVLFITDGKSRLSCVRGYDAMQQFKQFYSTIAEVTMTTMDSKTFCRTKPDLSVYSVVWVDNIISREFNDIIVESMRNAFERVAPGWKEDAERVRVENEPAQKAYEEFQDAVDSRVAALGDDEKAIEEYLTSVDKKLTELREAGTVYDKYMAQANEYRSLTLRVVYTLDEFVWDAPVARNKSIVEAKIVTDCLSYADTVVVPNNELRIALEQLKLTPMDKDIVVIPTYVSSFFYPTHKVFLKASDGYTSIRKPKILVKGTDIPQGVQNFIIHSCNEYEFTLSTVCDLDPRLMKLLAPRMSVGGKKLPPIVRHVMHWANPYVTEKNITETMAMERDAGFDFVILTEPETVESDIYNITITDTDALLAIASGSVVFAQIADAHFDKGVHLCNECGPNFVFGNAIKPAELHAIIEKWRITVNWDEAYTKQRTLMEHRLVSDPAVLAGYFHSMLGRRVSIALKARFDEGMAKLKKSKEAEQTSPLADGTATTGDTEK